MTDERFIAEHIDAWRREGGVLIENFFTPAEVAQVQADFERVFGRTQGAAAALEKKRDGEIGRFNPAQFSTFEAVPLDCSPALNLIGVHPALIRFAQSALDCTDVHLYQCQVWAKFTGDADYDQPFHCDFGNHTLTVPAEDDHHPTLARTPSGPRPFSPPLPGGLVLRRPEENQDDDERKGSGTVAPSHLHPLHAMVRVYSLIYRRYHRRLSNQVEGHQSAFVAVL